MSISPDEAELAARALLEYVGEDANREGLLETPARMTRALAELTRGYTVDPVSLFKTFANEADSHDLVIVRDIPFYSLCEHHVLPFFGVAHIAYIPGQRIAGLSKFARLVDAFSRRLQVQERLTAQVADTIMEALTPAGCGVVIDAKHFCMEMRGVSKQGAVTRTVALRGLFRSGIVRGEFLQSLPKGE